MTGNRLRVLSRSVPESFFLPRPSLPVLWGSPFRGLPVLSGTLGPEASLAANVDRLFFYK